MFYKRLKSKVGTLILCDFSIFDVKKTTEITRDSFQPISNMSNISLAMGMHFRW